METGRREADKQEKTLAEKVAVLDKDVQNLRVEFNDFRKNSLTADKKIAETITKLDAKIDLHLVNEEIQHKQLNENILNINTAVNSNAKSVEALRDELKEPLEVYKTAKYGARAGKIFVETMKWLAPLVAGILLGWNALQVKQLDNINITQNERPQNNGQDKTDIKK